MHATHGITLRGVLQILVAGLMLTVFVIVGLINLGSVRRATDNLTDEILRLAAADSAHRIERMLDAGRRTVHTLKVRATHGRIALDDQTALATTLGDLLKYEPRISRLLYGDAPSGAVIGATRNAEDLVLVRTMEAGTHRVWYLDEDGSLLPHSDDTRIDLNAPERPWFKAAADGGGEERWIGPFANVVGVPTLAVSAAVEDPATGAIRGVFTAHFYVASLEKLLQQATVSRPDMRVILMAGDGRVIAASDEADDVFMRDAAATLQNPRMRLSADDTHEAQFTSQGLVWTGGARGFRVADDSPDEEWFVAYFVPRPNLFKALYEHQRFTLPVGSSVLLLGVALGAALARRISTPLRKIADDLIRVASYDLTTAPSPRSFVKEVTVIADATDRMKASLRSFGRYVPSDVVRGLLASGEEARLGGELRVLSLHFSDIAGFTPLSEQLAPAQVVEYLAEYLELMTSAIRGEGGIVDQVIGDGILALFNAPALLAGHAAANCRAALAAQRSLVRLRAAWQPLGRPQIRARIGLHTGEVMVGNFGTHEHLAYGVIGDAVNLSSRLEGLNKVYGTSILASADLRATAGPGFEWRTLDRVAVVGRSGGTEVSELLGESHAVAAAVLAARDAYEEALAAYTAGRFESAADAFRRALAMRPDDRAAQELAERSAAYARQPPADWDGIFVATRK